MLRVVASTFAIANGRPRDFRHTFASRALALCESLAMTGKLLGHRKVQTTALYAHLARDSVGVTAERVSVRAGSLKTA